MQGAGAPQRQGQGPAGMGALGRPWVLLLTYLLTTLDLTSLFMQFSILPVSTRSRGASLPQSLITHRCHGRGQGGNLMPPRPLAGGALATLELSEEPRACAS